MFGGLRLTERMASTNTIIVCTKYCIGMYICVALIRTYVRMYIRVALIRTYVCTYVRVALIRTYVCTYVLH